MKKIISLVSSIFIGFVIYGQTANPSVDFSEGMGNPLERDLYCVKKGNIIIDPWYGLGSLNLFPESDTLENFKSLYLGPMGVCGEYMVTDEIGVGIDFIYNRQGFSSSDPNNIDGMGNLVTYNYKFKAERTRIHLRFNYHFAKDENFDAYLHHRDKVVAQIVNYMENFDDLQVSLEKQRTKLNKEFFSGAALYDTIKR